MLHSDKLELNKIAVSMFIDNVSGINDLRALFDHYRFIQNCIVSIVGRVIRCLFIINGIGFEERFEHCIH